MIRHTNAFKSLKDQTQQTFDFAILVSYAVKSLNYDLESMAKGRGDAFLNGPMPLKPDTFNGEHVKIGKILDSAKHYKAEVTKSIRLSSFSFFEAYVGDVLEEIAEFHDCALQIRASALAEDHATLSTEQSRALRALQAIPKKRHLDLYRKLSKDLEGSPIVMPHRKLLRLAIEAFFNRAGEYKASEIPKIVSDYLGLTFSEHDLNRFRDIREARNRIAHGEPLEKDLYIQPALTDNQTLRDLALQIDRHVLQYWFVIDPVNLSASGM